MPNILVIAPGHDERDRRVNRSLEVFNEVYDSVTVVYESRFSLSSESFIKIDGVQYCYIDKTIPFMKVIPRLGSYYRWIQSMKCKYSVIYVHDSGVLGLFLVRFLKKNNAKSKVLFDYHDYVDWEVFFQIGKVIRVPFWHKIFWKLSLVIIRLSFINRDIFDGLVGISESQKNSLMSFLKTKRCEHFLIVPNTREKINLVECLVSESKKITFLWIGNVVNGRDLELIMSYLDKFEESQVLEFSLKIIGNIVSSELFSTLKERIYFEYAGGFKNDQDILNKLDDNLNVGVFMGWNDDFNIGINEIASPNKMYSYINIGIPIIYNPKLKDMESVLGSQVGLSASDYDGFLNAALKLKKNYDVFRGEVLLKRNSLEWDESVKQKFKKYLINNFLD